MKKMIITLGVLMVATVSTAYTIKINDIIHPAHRVGDNKNITVEVESLTRLPDYKINDVVIAGIAKTNAEFAVALSKAPIYKTIDKGILLQFGVRSIPGLVDEYISSYAKSYPKTAALFSKYDTINEFNSKFTLQEFLDIYVESTDLYKWKNVVSSKFIPIIKKHIRSQGKSFVVRTVTNADGTKTTVNPMKEYTERLTTIINDGKLNGINEFLAEMSCTERLSDDGFLSDTEIEELKNKILIDEVKFDKNVKLKLEKNIGVKALNDFIKLYNEGV